MNYMSKLTFSIQLYHPGHLTQEEEEEEVELIMEAEEEEEVELIMEVEEMAKVLSQTRMVLVLVLINHFGSKATLQICLSIYSCLSLC